MVTIYKFGIKYFGQRKAVDYLLGLERFLLELAERQELAKDADTISASLKYYSYKAHVIFYVRDTEDEIYVVRVLGKRMNFMEHL